MHPAYGRIGEQDVGGLEVIGYDPATDQFRTHFFDHNGNVITETLTFRDGAWMWQAIKRRWEGGCMWPAITHRCRGVFTDNGRTLTAGHEHSDDGKRWTPSMIVTLRKVD